MSKVKDVKETVNQAVRFAIAFPCHICKYEGEKGRCNARYRYKGCCPVFHLLKTELLKMREIE